MIEAILQNHAGRIPPGYCQANQQNAQGGSCHGCVKSDPRNHTNQTRNLLKPISSMTRRVGISFFVRVSSCNKGSKFCFSAIIFGVADTKPPSPSIRLSSGRQCSFYIKRLVSAYQPRVSPTAAVLHVSKYGRFVLKLLLLRFGPSRSL